MVFRLSFLRSTAVAAAAHTRWFVVPPAFFVHYSVYTLECVHAWEGASFFGGEEWEKVGRQWVHNSPSSHLPYPSPSVCRPLTVRTREVNGNDKGEKRAKQKRVQKGEGKAALVVSTYAYGDQLTAEKWAKPREKATTQRCCVVPSLGRKRSWRGDFARPPLLPRLSFSARMRRGQQRKE